MSVVFIGLLLPALPFLKGRLPVARVHGPTARSTSTGREWMKSRNWNLFMIASTLQAFGNCDLVPLPKLNHYRLLHPRGVAAQYALVSSLSSITNNRPKRLQASLA
jgi:MFS transporter, MCT family, solute carrier family 16 (monocarboxylic acid transporters), member 10